MTDWGRSMPSECMYRWKRSHRAHMCECRKEHRQKDTRHVCHRCSGWLGFDDKNRKHPFGCRHRQRTVTFMGGSICEECEKIAQGWKTCIAPSGCLNDTPGKLCPEHELRYEACEECSGQGVYECQEQFCHGEYCEDGMVTCPHCSGEGVMKRVEYVGRSSNE